MKNELDGITLGPDDSDAKPKGDLSGITLKDTSLPDSYESASRVDPGLATSTLRISKKTGVNPAYLAKNPNEARAIENAPSQEFFDRVSSGLPHTAKLLSDPGNMAKTHDDLANIAAHEQLVHKFRYADGFMEEIAAGQQSSIPFMLGRGGMPDLELNPDAGFWHKQAYGAGALSGDLPVMMAAGAAALPAGPMASAAAAFGLPAAVKKALADYYTKGDVKGAQDFLSRITEPAQEGVEQGAVGILTAISGGIGAAYGKVAGVIAEALGMEAASASLKGELPSAEGLAGAAVTIGGLHAVGTLPEIRAHMEQSRAADAARYVHALDEAATSSKWRTRDPEGYAEHVDSMTRPALVPLEAFEKAFEHPGIAAGELGLGQAYAEAVRTGGDVAIPMGTFLSEKLDKHREALASDVKFSSDPNAKTVSQAAAATEEKPVEQVPPAVVPSNPDVAEAQSSVGQTSAPEGTDPKTAALHAKLQAESVALAEKTVYDASLAELKPEHLARVEAEKERIVQETRNEVSNDPLFQAMALLNPEEPLPTGTAKFEAWYQANDYLNGKLDESNQLRFDMVAEASGYTSGDEMARQIILTDAKTAFTSEVNKRVEAKMQAERAVARDKARADALAAVHNEKSLEVRALTAEIMEAKLQSKDQDAAYMAEIHGRARLRAEQAKAEAKVAFELKAVEDAGDFRKYFTAERDAAVRAARAADKGDIKEAAKATQQQLNAHAMAAESLRARSKIEKWGKTLTKAQRLDKTYFKGDSAVDHFAQLASIIGRFGFQHGEYDPSMKTESLGNYIKRMEDAGAVPVISDWIQNETFTKDWKKLSMSELHEVSDAVKNIKSMYRSIGEMRAINRLARLETIVDRLHDSKLKNTAGGNIRGAGTLYTRLEKAIYAKNAIRQALIDNDGLFFKMDGAEHDGEYHTTFQKSKVKAENAKSELMTEFIHNYDKIHSEYSSRERKDLNAKAIYIPEFKDSLTRNNLIRMWMHQGTEGNQAKLLSVPRKGVQWTQEMVDKVLDRELTKRDMDLGQARLDLIGSYRGKIGELYKRLAGFEPTWVEAQTIHTKHGDYPGGYSPLDPDPDVTVSGYESRAEDEALSNPVASWKARTKNGFIKTRQDGAKYAVSLDPDGVVRHVSDVIHDLTMREWVIDAERILKHPRVAEDLIDALGNPQYQALNHWVKQIAGNDSKLARQAVERIMTETKRRTVAVQLGLKITTMLRQLDITVAAGVRPREFGRKEILNGLVEDYGGFWRKPTDPLGSIRELGEFVLGKSAYMRERLPGTERDLLSASRQEAGKNKEVAEFMNSGIGFMDRFITHSIWKSAYKKGLKLRDFDDEAAVLYADDIIRGSNAPGRRSDLPAMMRSPGMGELFTMYRGQVDRQLNLMYKAGLRLEKAGPKGAAEFASTYMNVMLIPSLMGALISYGLPNSEERRRKWGKAALMENFAGLPVLNTLIERGVDAMLDLKGSTSLTPLGGVIDAYNNATAKLSSRKASTQQKIEALTGVATFTGLPIPGYSMQPIPNQIPTLVFNAMDIANGRMKFEPRDLLRRRPVKERNSSRY